MSDDSTEVIEERGEYRATITLDQWPSEPDFESGCPVLRIDGRDRVEDTGYGSGSAKHDGLTTYEATDALAYFIANAGIPDGVGLFARYLRCFHGGDAVGYHLGYSNEYGYCAYTTREMARWWGHTDTDTIPLQRSLAEALIPELNEWQAYVEGDVYVYDIERKVITVTGTLSLDRDVLHPLTEGSAWESVDSCSGYYGEQYAREAALEALDGYAPKDGAA